MDDDRYDDNATQRLEDNDTRLMEMLAAQAAHREDGSAAGDEEAIAADKKLSDTEKKSLLQKSLHNAASNGDVDQVGRVLQDPARKYVDINGPDEEGTAPIIYASCFVSSCSNLPSSSYELIGPLLLGSSGCSLGSSECWSGS